MPASVRHYIKPKEYKELHIGHLDLLRERKNKKKQQHKIVKDHNGTLKAQWKPKEQYLLKEGQRTKKVPTLLSSICSRKHRLLLIFETCYSKHFLQCKIYKTYV